jgi:hypothetical protein
MFTSLFATLLVTYHYTSLQARCFCERKEPDQPPMKPLMVCHTAKKGLDRLLSDLDLSAQPKYPFCFLFLFVSVVFGGCGLRDVYFQGIQTIAP